MFDQQLLPASCILCTEYGSSSRIQTLVVLVSFVMLFWFAYKLGVYAVYDIILLMHALGIAVLVIDVIQGKESVLFGCRRRCLMVVAKPFVKRFAVCYRTVSPVSLSVCQSVCNVSELWPNGWIDQNATWYGGRPWPRRHCVRWGPNTPKKLAQQPHYSISVLAKWSPISATAELLFAWRFVVNTPAC